MLILLIEEIGAEALERLANRDEVALLKNPEEITRGGGYPLMAIRGQQHVLMPKKVVLWEPLKARAFAGRNHEAVVKYLNALLASGG